MAIPIVPIGVLLGKADSAWKLVGGSSILFNALRSRIFGKVLRTVEYPDGELKTIRIHRMTVHRLKTIIAEAQPPPFPTSYIQPEDIKGIHLFTSPHFTELIKEDSDVNALPDNAWLFWSLDTEPIPRRGVKLDGSQMKKRESRPSDDEMQERAFGLARDLRSGTMLTRHQYDRVVDLAVDRDAGLLAIARNFNTERDFRHHALRLLERRDPNKILLGFNPQDETKDSDDEQDQKRNIEAQPELASRE